MKSPAQKLCDKLVELFSTRKEVRKINIFGRLAENISDKYSDVDIKIISDNPLDTQQFSREIIENNISPIIETFTLASDRNLFAEMIMLKGHSPYQKIDIGIERDGFGILFKPMITIYKNDNARGLDKDCGVVKIRQTVDHNMRDVLFGIPRVTKCFFRKDYDMYRRWKCQTNALLVILSERYTGWNEISDKRELTASDAHKLSKNLSNADRAKLRKIFPSSGALIVPTSYLNSLKFYIEIAREKANALGGKLNDEFIDYMYDFAETEIAKLKLV